MTGCAHCDAGLARGTEHGRTYHLVKGERVACTRREAKPILSVIEGGRFDPDKLGLRGSKGFMGSGTFAAPGREAGYRKAGR